VEQVKGQLWSHWLPKCVEIFRRLPPVPINNDVKAYYRYFTAAVDCWSQQQSASCPSHPHAANSFELLCCGAAQGTPCKVGARMRRTPVGLERLPCSTMVAGATLKH
jgi:hypothetical protein